MQQKQTYLETRMKIKFAWNCNATKEQYAGLLFDLRELGDLLRSRIIVFKSTK